MAEINTFCTELDGEQTLLAELQNSVNLYQVQFARLVSIQDDIGLDKNSGYQGYFRSDTHALEDEFRCRNQTALQLQPLQMRRS
jgi:methyl-accepting chemotaxis protein